MELWGVAKGEELAAAVTRIEDGSAVILLVAESRKVLDFMNRLINPPLGESPPVGLVNRGVTRRTLSATDNSRFDHANPASPAQRCVSKTATFAMDHAVLGERLAAERHISEGARPSGATSLHSSNGTGTTPSRYATC